MEEVMSNARGITVFLADDNFTLLKGRETPVAGWVLGA
jgi:hypothetical protein